VRFDEHVIAEFRANAGRVGGELAQTPMVLIHHIGARSGTACVTPLAYQPLRGRLAIVGSNGGSPADPGWCHNLRAHPRIDVEVGTERFSVRARELDDAARAEVWPTLVAGAPVLGEYQAKATRRFPVFLLRRESEGSPDMKPRLSVLTLGVADLDRSLAFYRGGLGFRTPGIIGEEFEDGAVVFIDLEGGLRLALWPSRSLARDTGLTLADEGTPRISLGHNMASKEEVDAVMQRARCAGATIVKEAADTFYAGYAGYFQDPDRYLWEIVWNPAFLPADTEGSS
jgi:uncharacterized protein